MGKTHVTRNWVLTVTVIHLAILLAPAYGAVLEALSPSQFRAMLERPEGAADVVLLDIRTPGEFAAGHIRGALLIDYYAGDFVDRLKTLDRHRTYLIYCRSGNRTGRSLAIFEKLGFGRVYHLGTGLIGWTRESYPLVQNTGS